MASQGASQWALLIANLPGRASEAIGLLLLNPHLNQLRIKIRPRWWEGVPEVYGPEVWEAISEDLEEKSREMGGAAVVDWLECTASHALQVTALQTIGATDIETALNKLYQLHVDSGGRQSGRAVWLSRVKLAWDRAVNSITLPICSAQISILQTWRVFFRHRWVHAALAASLISAAILTTMRRHPTARSVSQRKLEIPDSNLLPAFCNSPVRPVLSDLQFLAQRCFRPPHGRGTASSHLHRAFNPERLVLVVPRPQPVNIVLPNP